MRFTNLAGLPRNNLGRLNSNGTLDAGVSAEVDGGVGCLALQPDGKILVAGGFTTLAGQTRTNIGRLNGDGSLDTTCHPAADRTVSLALQPDGKIVAGGDFTTLCGQSRSHLGRLNRDGTLDASFNPSVGSVSGRVRCLAVQADESILVGCSLPLGFLGWNNLTRLHSNGTLDTTFNPRVTNYVYCLAMQTDGKILVGTGSPTYRDPLGPRYYYPLARLNSNGSVDAAFETGSLRVLGRQPTSPLFGPSVYSLAVQADGKALVGGDFSVLAGQPRLGIGRLNSTDPATQSLACNRTNITWLRGGTSPEVWQTSFDVSTNGTDWISLGAGTRIAGGWQLAGVRLPAHATIRARGSVSGGRFNGSTWYVETNSVIPNQPPVADAGATKWTVISPNGTNAQVILNGTRSSDPDGDLLHYACYEAGSPDPLAQGPVAVVVLPVGSHSLALVVNDRSIDGHQPLHR